MWHEGEEQSRASPAWLSGCWKAFQTEQRVVFIADWAARPQMAGETMAPTASELFTVIFQRNLTVIASRHAVRCIACWRRVSHVLAVGHQKLQKMWQLFGLRSVFSLVFIAVPIVYRRCFFVLKAIVVPAVWTDFCSGLFLAFVFNIRQRSFHSALENRCCTSYS